MVQWLGLSSFTAKGLGLIPGWGTKTPQVMQCDQKSKTKLTELKREINCNTVIAGEFNTPLSTVDIDQTENQYGNSESEQHYR